MPRLPRRSGVSRLRVLSSVAVSAVLALGFTVGPAAASYADPEDPATSDPTPGPLANPNNPFDEPVGGVELGRAGTVVANPTTEVPAPPNVQIGAYVVADLDTGEVLAAKNAHEYLRPASTLKTLTAVTLLPRLEKRARYIAQAKDSRVIGSKVGIEPGIEYTIEDLFHGMFLPSGNDAAVALANASGGVRATVDLMNDEAERLGAFDTHAVNPHGLDAEGQFSSAYDLSLIASEGMRRADFQRYCSTTAYDFPGRKNTTYNIQNSNDLLTTYDGSIGIKNGYTTKAKNTLVTAAERDGHRILVTALHAESPFYEKVESLLDWGFSAVDQVEPVGELVTPQDVAEAKMANSAHRSHTSAVTGTPDADEGAISETSSSAAAPNAGASLISAQLARLPMWLWLAGALFVVLAAGRVYSYTRTQRGGRRKS